MTVTVVDNATGTTWYNDPLGSGTPSDNFGATAVGAPLDKTFAVENSGASDVALTSGSLTLPAGFSLVGSFPATVPAGGNATFTVQMDATSAASPSGELSFEDNDPGGGLYQFGINGSVIMPSVAIQATTQVADEQLSTAGVFTVTRTGPTNAPLTVDYSAGGTAQSGLDYAALPGDVTIPAGLSSTTIAVNPASDGKTNEIQQVILPAPTGGTYTLSLGADTTPALAYNASAADVAAALEALPSVGAGRASVTGSGTTVDPFVVTFEGPLGGRLPQIAGDGSQLTGGSTITTSVTQQGEFGGTVQLSVTAQADYSLGSPSQDTVTVLDGAPVVTVAATTPTADEVAGTSGQFTFYRNGPTAHSLTVDYYFTGSALDGVDFAWLPGSVTFAAGQSSVTINIAPQNNGLPSADKTVQLTLAMSMAGEYQDGYSLAGATNDTVTIVNNNLPIVSLAASAPQADAKTGKAGQFTVVRSGKTDQPLTIDYTIGGTAVAGTDYSTISGSITILAGQSMAAIDVTPLAGAAAGSTVILSLASSAGYKLSSTTSGTVTIADDTLPQVSVQASTPLAYEQSGQAGAFTISIDAAQSQPLTVDYTTNGTAVSGTDFTPLTGSVIVPAGQTSVTIPVTPLTDPAEYGATTVGLSLSTNAAYELTASKTAVVSIIGNLSLPAVTLTATAPIADENSSTDGVFTVTRSGSTTAAMNVYYTVAGTAVAGTDYSPLAGSIQIPAGQASATITIAPIIDPAMAGSTRTVLLSLTNYGASDASDYTLGNPASDTVTISDLPTVSIQATTATASENAGTAGQFTVTRAGDTSQALTVDYTIAGTAIGGTDYQTLSGSVALAAGATSATIDVTPIDAHLVGGSQTVVLALADATGYTIGTASDTVTIEDDDPPSISIAATTPTASERTQAAGTFTVSRTGPTDSPLTVSYSVAGTAVAGTDYQSLTGAITIPAGASSATIPVTPIDAGIIGGSMTVQATLSAGTGYLVASPASDTVTIEDDDLPLVTLATTQPNAAESGTTGTFTVTRNGPTTSPLIVLYTISGSAVNGTDYQTLSGNVVIPSGSASATITVTPINDPLVFADQTVQVTLASASDYLVGSNYSGAVTIFDDNTPTVSIQATTPTADEETASAGQFTVTRLGAPDNPLTVNYTVGGTAVAGTNYSALSGVVTIPAGQSSATIDVTPIDDGEVDEVQQVIVPAATGGSYTLSIGSNTTTALAYNATAAQVQSALAALVNIGTGNVAVSGSGTSADPFLVTFRGALVGVNVPQITGNDSALTGTAQVDVVTTTQGQSGVNEVQVVGYTSSTGVSGGDISFTVDGQMTYPPISCTADAATVQSALDNALENVTGTTGNVSVVAVDTGPDTYTWQLTFLGPMGSQDLPQTTTDASQVYDANYNMAATSDDSTITDGGTTGAVSEVQQISVNGATGGTFTLSFNGATTSPIPYNDTASDLEYQLQVLSTISDGNVAVTGNDGGPWTVTFQGALANQDVPQITADSSGLTGTAAITTSIVTPAAQNTTVIPTLSASTAYSLGSVTSDTVTIDDNDNLAPTTSVIGYAVQTGQALSTGAPGVLYGATDPGNLALSAVLVSGASHGTLTLNSDGSFAYTPAAGYVGSDSFVFQAFDGTYYSLPITVGLSVQAAPAPQITVLDASGNTIANNTGSDPLGATLVGAPITTTLTIENTGTAALTLDPNSLVVPAGFSVMTPFASTVAAGASTTFELELTASTAGSYSGSVSFTENDPNNGTFQFAISGTVNAPAPQITVAAGGSSLANGATFTYPTRGVGEPVPQTFTIENTGTAALSLNTGSLTLPSGYSLITPFAASVAPGDSTTLVVQLNAAAAGAYDGSLQFTDNDANNSTFTLALAGSVIASPIIAVLDNGNSVANGTGSVTLGAAVQGAPLTKTLTIDNNGSTDLTLNPSQVTLPAGFTVSSPFATDVPAGGSTTITLEVDGSTVGDFQGTASFPTNDPAAATFTFQVDAQIQSPTPQMQLYDGTTEITPTSGTVDFGATQVGTAVDKTLTIENIGAANLVLPAVMDLPSGYRLVSLSATNIAPGGSASLVMELVGSFAGTYDGTASIDSNDPANEPFAFNLTGVVQAPQLEVSLGSTELSDETGRVDFGDGVVGAPVTDTFTVTNTGDGPLTLADPISVPLGFSVTSDFGATTLAAGQSTTFAVQLDDQTAGGYGGPLAFETNDPGQLAYVIEITGQTGLPAMQVAAGATTIADDGSNFDFGNTPVGTAITKTFTITNSGTGELTLSDPIGLPAGFTLVSDFGQTQLAAGASTTFAVELTAAAAGYDEGEITFGNNASLAGSFGFKVSGGVGVGKLQVLEGATDVTSPAQPVDFGLTVPGDPVTETFTVANNGSGNLVLSDPIGLPAGFSQVTDFGATTLAPGASTSFQVELSAPAGGIYSGDVTFGTNLADEPTFSLPISGAVVELSNFRLWNDTGRSAADGVTSDPTVAGNLLGLASGTTVEVQFDDNHDGTTDETMQAGGDTPFAFTPKDLAPGPVTIDARVHVVNAVLGDVYTNWSPLSFTLETGTNAKPVVANLALQTVTVAGSSPPKSSDSTITGLVYNDGNASYMAIQVDTNGDGLQDDVATTDANGQFVYTPQKLSPGTYTYHFRAVENDYPDGQITGDWTAFTFVIVAPNAPVVDQLALANITGPGTNTTTDPSLTGHVTADGNPQQVEVDFDYNGDGVVDASAMANADGTFSYTPLGLQPGLQTIHVRAVNVDDNLLGSWTTISFTLAAATAPTVSTLALAYDTGSSSTDNVTDDPTVTGTLTGGVGVANVTVQFDTNGDGTPDGSTTSDSSGNFTYLPLGLQPGSVTVSARAVASDPATGATLVGSWKSLTFTLSTTAAPTVNGLALEHPTGTDPTTGEPTATDPTLTGSLSDGGALTSFMKVEYDTNGDGTPDGSTMTDAKGDFTLTPQGLPLGTVTVEVRGVAQDPQTGADVDGAWTSISFVLQQDPVNQIPTPPGGNDAQTTGDQVAATSQQASQQAVNDALAAFNTAMGYGSTSGGQVALAIGTYTALSGMVGGRVESGSIYDAENGSIAAPAGVGGSSGGGSGSGVTGPSLPGSSPVALSSTTPLTLSGLATPTAASGSISNQAISSSTTLGPGTDSVSGTLSGSWSIVVTPDSQNPNVTDWTINLQITAPYNSLLGGTYADTSGTASIAHDYADDVNGNYMFTFQASGTTTSTPAGNILAGTYTLGESNNYSFGYNDTPITTDPTASASLSSSYTTGASGSHSFEHEETGGSFSDGAGTGSNWPGQPTPSGGPALTSDYLNVENESYSAGDGGSGNYGNGSASGADGGGNTQNSQFGYNRNHFEAGSYGLGSGGSVSTSNSYSDDQKQTYSSTDNETQNFNFGTEGGQVNGTINISDTINDLIDDSESGNASNGLGGFQLNATSFNDYESDTETYKFSETGSDTQNLDGISSGGTFSYNETDNTGGSDDENGSYNVSDLLLSITNGSFTDNATANDTYSYADSGAYGGTQIDAGDLITLSGTYNDSAGGNDNATEEDGGNYNESNQTTTDNGQDSLDENADVSYSSGGSDSANDASITVTDSFSDKGGGNGSFSEAGTFSDDSSGETADGTDTDGVSASDSASATETASGSDASSNFTASDSANNNSSFNFHDTGNYDITPAVDDFTGNEGETDTSTAGDQWSQSGAVSGSNPFQYTEGGGDSVSGTYNESDSYTDDETSASASSDNSTGTFTDNDGGTASGTYSDSGTSSDASSTTNYSDSQSVSDNNSYNDSGSFDDNQSTSAGTSDSQNTSFSSSDNSAVSAASGESGTYTDASDSGAFTANSTSQSDHIETDNGNQGISNSGTINFSVSDSSHTTANDSDGGHFTNGETGNYSDGNGNDDTEKSSQSGSTVTNATGTVTSGTFGDDSRKINSDYGSENDQQGSEQSDKSKVDFVSSTYLDSGNFSDSSLADSRNATFTAGDLNVAADHYDDSNNVAQTSDEGDDATIASDSSNGNYTNASGTLSETATGTADVTQLADAENSQQSSTTNPEGPASSSQSYSASIGDKSHESGSETEVNGAVTAANEPYTEDDLAKMIDTLVNTATINLGQGETETISSSGTVTTSNSFHDGGTHDVASGVTTDTGSNKDTEHDVNSGSDQVTIAFDNEFGVGATTQTDAGSDTKDYVDTSNYTDTNGADDSHDTFDNHDVAAATTSLSTSAHALNDAGTSWTETSSDTTTSNDATNGNDDDNAGVIADETDNFDDKNTDDTHTSQHTQSDQPAASAGPTFPPLIEETIPLWEQAPEWPGGDFEPPSYAGPSGSTSSTADATSDYTEKDEQDGTTTDVSGATTTDEKFDTSATQTDGNTQWQSTAGNYSDSSGNSGSFTSVVATSHSDSETDKNNGTDDAGVTTDDYNNKGSQSDAKNTSYSFDATSSVGGITAHGHGKNTANYSDTTSFTETGDYTDDPSQPEADGYSDLNQTIGYTKTVIEGATQQLTGDESGGDANSNVSLSGSGTYTTNASASVNSNSTVNDNVAAGTDAQSGSYDSDKSVGTSSSFQVTGKYVEGAGNSWNTTGANYDHTATSWLDTKDAGPYSTPPASGTETVSGAAFDHTDATVTTNGYPVSWSTNDNYTITPWSVPNNLDATVGIDNPVVNVALACFAAGTPIRTADGSKPIEALRPGDLVLASPDGDPMRGVELKRIVETYANPPARLINIHVGEQVIRATLHHPFYVRDRGWTGASALRPGDLLLSDDGSWRPVREIFDNGNVEPVYNLHVEDHRTYFVGDVDWGFSVLVHNQSGNQQARVPAARDAQGNTFADLSGPARIVGFVGGGEAPGGGESGGIAGTYDAFGNFVPNPSNPIADESGMKELVGELGKKIGEDGTAVSSKLYGSSIGKDIKLPDGTVVGFAPSKALNKVVDEEADRIIAAAKAGALNGDNVYRLLVAGHSWGGHKAVAFAKLLRAALEKKIKREINQDPTLRQTLAGLVDKVRIYLVTMDVRLEGQHIAPKAGAVPKPKGVEDWFNIYEDDDGGFQLLPKNPGIEYPGADENVNKGTLPPGKNPGHHAHLPQEVLGDILSRLGY